MKKRYRFSIRALAAFFVLTAVLSFCSCAAPYHKAQVFGMGTLCSFVLASDGNDDGDGMPDLVPVLNDTEELLSHRIETSFAARVNGGETVLADEALLAALRLCEEMKIKTDGMFSLSVLPLTSLWQFEGENLAPPAQAEIDAALAKCRDSRIVMTEAGVFALGGALDFGSFGKGYACDALAAVLNKKGESGLISVGGSIAAVGEKRSANGKKTEPWQVGIRDPFSENPNDLIGTLALTDTFVSTSGSYEKCFVYQDKTYHHILDARTGMPVENDLISVTVIAQSGVLSDVLSTACFMVGSEKAVALAAEYGAQIVAVKTDGTLLLSEGAKALFTGEDTGA